jgi:hypothetical protein
MRWTHQARACASSTLYVDFSGDERKFNEAQVAFIGRISNPNKSWMSIQEHSAFEAAQGLIEQLHGGRTDPAAGHVVVLG